jgi:hypothetical protein
MEPSESRREHRQKLIGHATADLNTVYTHETLRAALETCMKGGIEIVVHCPEGVHAIDFWLALGAKLRGFGWAIGTPLPKNTRISKNTSISKIQAKVVSELAADKVKRLSLFPLNEAATKTAQDIFLHAVCTHEGEWTKSQIEMLQKYSRDKRFRERLARAMENGKPPPLFDRIDQVILSNWRTFRFESGKKIMPVGLPGLRDWSPYAAGQLFTRAKLFAYNDESDSASAEARYKKRCQRLGLRSKKRYLIRDFFFIGNEAKVIRAG